ncbi:non-ribosomal peptide synthetase [Paenibacillus sp. FJAT-26967]|uniref:non-ribosomal peptide synthetase n=1 Tax=Paenibacillus sp. FJAT-26967 TaxID=1729690 RepID=UPI000838303C|nr:non-ribosomal peptide synthetase [Paenibacillus sp. FJAT-26967]
MLNVGSEKLNKQDIEDILSLTSMQEGILFHHLSEAGSDTYIEQFHFRITGTVHSHHFIAAWNNVARSNEMLRAVYRWSGLEKPVQIIRRQVELPIRIAGFEEAGVSRKSLALEARKLVQLTTHPFRIDLMLLSESESEMIVTFHHILFDGWSSHLLLQEFIAAYTILTEGIQVPQPVRKTSFKQFVLWKKKKETPMQLEFWKNYLKGHTAQTEIPYVDKSYNGSQPQKGHSYRLSIPEAVTNKVHASASMYEATVSALLYMAWGITLQKYNSTQDVMFGITLSGRPPEISGIDQMAGLFINTVPLRFNVECDQSVSSILKQTHRMLLEMREFEHTPLARINTCLDFDRQQNTFSSIVVVENYPADERMPVNPPIEIDLMSKRETTNYDLVLEFAIKDTIQVTMHYDAVRIAEEDVARMAGHLLRTIEQIVEMPSVHSSDIRLLSDQEIHEMDIFNETDQPFSLQTTIVQRFEDAAAKYPDHTAVVYRDKRMTYRELQQKSAELAAHLAQRGVQSGSIVGLMVEQDIRLVVGMLGILRAGAAFVPVDPHYPIDRIHYMIKDSGADIMVSHHPFIDLLPAMDSLDMDSCTSDVKPAAPLIMPADLAYVIYTSGTTGKPKGVMIEDKSLVNLCCWMVDYLEIRETDRASQYASMSFDAAVMEIFPYLISGASVHLLEKSHRLDIGRMNAYFETNKITAAFLPPQVCEQFMEYPNHSLRFLITGGDVLRISRETNYRLINLYGPTENTVVATYYPIDKPAGPNIPIGRPIANEQVYILDPHGNMQPVGVPGELHIAGAGLSRGYLHHPELTSKAFVDAKWGQQTRLYRTGDLAKWNKGGNVEFLGRMDNQVKVRGYRIELGEIEKHLMDTGDIKEAVVLSAGLQGENYLCAFYVPRHGEAAVDTIKESLAGVLPAYMIPKQFVQVEQIPLTPNGKIDKRHLLGQAGELRNDEPELYSPDSPLERQIYGIWSSLLDKNQFSIEDNFFEIGGDSILLMRMHAKIDKLFPGKITVQHIFAYPTIAKLAAFIRGSENRMIGANKLPQLVLPADFFGSRASNEGDTTFRIQVDPAVSLSLKEITRKHTVTEIDLLLAAYVFTISQWIKQPVVRFHFISLQDKLVHPIDCDLGKKEEFIEIMNDIYRSRSDKELAAPLRLPQPANSEESPAYTIHCSFADCRGGNYADIPSVYDLSVGVTDDEGQLGLICLYNSTLLLKSKVRMFMNMYVAVLNQISQKMK